MRKNRLSIGIFAHNEEKLIERCILSILSQKLESAKIFEIIVFSSGSTDKTDYLLTQIERKLREKDLPFSFRVIIEQERKGKYSSINHFLKIAKGDILVISSADVIYTRETLEYLIEAFKDPRVGIVSSHPIPITSNRLIDKIIDVEWQLHHLISLKKPKFGEVIALRNIIKRIPRTSVDEEAIAAKILKRGFKAVYAKDAIIYNFGPKTIKDFIKQRRRIFCGHLELQKREKYVVPSMDVLLVLKSSLKLIHFKNVAIFIFAVFLEAIARILGFFDFLFHKEKHYVWRIVEK